MQGCDRRIALRALRAEPLDPRPRLRVELGRRAVVGVSMVGSSARRWPSSARLRVPVERSEDPCGELGGQPRSTSSSTACRSYAAVASQRVGELGSEARLFEATRAPEHDRVGARALDRLSPNPWHGLLVTPAREFLPRLGVAVHVHADRRALGAAAVEEGAGVVGGALDQLRGMREVDRGDRRAGTAAA